MHTPEREIRRHLNTTPDGPVHIAQFDPESYDPLRRSSHLHTPEGNAPQRIVSKPQAHHDYIVALANGPKDVRFASYEQSLHPRPSPDAYLESYIKSEQNAFFPWVGGNDR
jgi:hypothetical protein